MSKGSGFERQFVNKMNDWFNNKTGIAFRLKQSRFTYQIIDVLVDSGKHGYYAIECKSVKYTKGRPIYFTQYFTTDKHGVSQITRTTDFIKASGRTGILMIEVRRGQGYKNIWYIYPWALVDKKFTKGDKGISWKEMKRDGKPFRPKRITNINKWSD